MPIRSRQIIGKRGPVRHDGRMAVIKAFMALGFIALGVKLFMLSVVAHAAYSRLAEAQHGAFEQLYPDRGAVYLSDPKSPSGRFPAAVNRSVALVYADPRQVKNPDIAAALLAPLLEIDESVLKAKLSNSQSRYAPLKRQASDDVAARIKALGLAGIEIAHEPHRFYPEGEDVGHLMGFVGFDAEGRRTGKYGIEGFWEEALAGKDGYIAAEQAPGGRLIGSAARDFHPAENGAELTLTIDRNIQFEVCAKLRDAVRQYNADGGTVIVMDPKTGAVLAMCSAPGFDPNAYSTAGNVGIFNNPATFDPYEPGSIFKPFTLAAAIDAGKVTPSTTYEDTGSVKIGPFTIKNSDGKGHGVQTMTQVLEESLNTGTIFAVRKLGPELFHRYVTAFGFGAKTGIELAAEGAGNVSSLEKRGEIWSATASFGQGITATPIQIAAAFSAIANGGKLMKPYIVGRVVASDGSVRTTTPTVVRQAITERAASLISGMLVQVVENGHGKRAAVRGYWVAGKTGTAQVARTDVQGYEKNASIGSFVGFAPVDDPAFVMLVELKRPKDVAWAESSAAPLFGEIGKFLVQYLQIPPERS